MIRSLIQRLLGDYALYRIYRGDGPAGVAATKALRFEAIDSLDVFGRTADPRLASLRSYSGSGAHGFAAWAGDDLAAACWYWESRSDRQGDTWPIHPAEAKLAQIVTGESHQGRGIATQLIAFSSEAMRARGFSPLYARIWHSNVASNRAFERAGWRYIAFVVQFAPLGIGPLRRIVLPPLGAGRQSHG